MLRSTVNELKHGDSHVTGPAGQKKICHAGLLILFIVMLTVIPVLQGCRQKPDILGQEPVIPLTDSTAMSKSEDPTGEGVVDQISQNDIDDASEDEAKEQDNGNDNSRTEDEQRAYEVAGVQLDEEQLKKMTAYFNLKEINPYLGQVYLTPGDFDEDVKSEPVKITCVAGSYDSNRLYSIFYRKDEDKELWNVVLRRESSTAGDDRDDMDFRFHSNTTLGDGD